MHRYKIYSTIFMVLMLATWVLVACSPVSALGVPKDTGAANQEAAAQKSIDPEETYKTSDGPVAPDWTLETLDGGTFRLADHQGEVVVMFFMASWCGSCVLEAQALAQLHEQYGDQGLTVVALNVEPQKNTEGVSQFRQLSDHAAYTWAFDTEYTVTQLYGVQSLDTTIIVDRSGKIAYRDAFITPFDTLAAEVEKWL